MISAMVDESASAAGGPVNTPESFLLKPGEEIRPADPGAPGSRQFMARVAAGRHPGVVSLMRHLSYAHLPENLRAIVEPFGHLARVLLDTLPDSPELTEALRKLVEAKDCATRARVDTLDV